MSKEKYIPALGFEWLTPFYDPIVHWTTRENVFKNALIEQAGFSNSQTILDLGCGTATLCLKIKKRFPEARIFALDVDEKMLAVAKGKAAKQKADIKFEQGFSDALPFADESFDRVVSTLFFHHLTNEGKRQTLREVFRVLKPDGELHIADFGVPRDAFQHLLSHYIQLIDSIETTRDNLEGQIPLMMRETGFSGIERNRYFGTIVGTIRLFKAVKL